MVNEETEGKKEEEQCCPVINDSEWNFKEHVWKDKPFLVRKHAQVFHFPLVDFGKLIPSALEEIKKKGYETDEPILMLDRETGFLGAEMLFGLKEGGKAEGGDIKKISGTFISKAFTGEYKDMSKWIKELSDYMKEKKGKLPVDYYHWYVNCPKCWKKQGGPKTVIFAKVSE
jgi:hypothetical protein